VGVGGDLGWDLIAVELHGRGVAAGQDQAGAPCWTDCPERIGRGDNAPDGVGFPCAPTDKVS
jgi:hypothetical protein